MEQHSSIYAFSNAWFENTARRVWDELLPQLKPQRVLEVGSYEGASTCYLIDRLAAQAPLEIHCVDTWQGGLEHQAGASAAADMAAVEQRFTHNTALASQRAAHAVQLHCHKGPSDAMLAALLAQGLAGHFDFVYVDGSHQARDVLADAVLGWRLLRTGGVMVFDDYLWSEPLPGGVDPLRCPKLAIDAFTTIHARELQIVSAPLYQLLVLKTA